MPRGLSRQVLNHDAREHSEFSLDVIQDTVIREIQAVGDLLARPV